MTKQILCILAVLCCGCIGFLNDATSVAIVFMESDKVCVRGNMYDVSDKKKSFDLRCNIKYARELVFEHIGKALIPFDEKMAIDSYIERAKKSSSANRHAFPQNRKPQGQSQAGLP